MVFIRKIRRGQRIYLAEVESVREGARVHQKFIRYVKNDSGTLRGKSKQILDSLIVQGPRISGSVIALNWIAEQIGLHTLLGSNANAILTLVYAHCHSTNSILKAGRWYKRTELGRLFGQEEMLDCQLRQAIVELSKQDLFAMQKSIFEKIMAFTKNKPSSVLYDVTNTYFTGNNCRMAKMGLDKEGVHGRKLIQIGLAVTKKHGFPIFHQLHPGNISDHRLFSEAILALQRVGIENGLIIYDRGMTSKVSVLELSTQHWKVIAGMPMHQGIKNLVSKMDLQGLESMRNRVAQGDTIFYVKAIKFKLGDTPGQLLILLNPRKAQSLKERRRASIVREQKRKKGTPHLNAKFKKYFTQTGGVNSHAVKREEQYDGLSFIFTNTRMPIPDIVHTYFSRNLIEQSFHGFKGSLALRPVRVWLEEHVKVHVFICYLAYSLTTTFRYLLDQKRGKPGFALLKGVSCEKAFEELTQVYRIYFEPDSELEPEKPCISRLISLTKLQDSITKAVSSTLDL